MLAGVLIVLIVLDLLVKVVALGLVPERRRPSAATAWLLVIFLLPGLGLLLFILRGRPGVRHRPPQQVQVEAQAGMILLRNNTYPPLPAAAGGPDWLRDAFALNSRLGWLDPVAGNRVELYADHRTATAAMAGAVAGAERFVHRAGRSTTDGGDDALAAALRKAQQRGVAVREVTGADLLVVDGRVAFGGSPPSGPGGPALTYRVEGPLAHSLSVVFAADWYRSGAEALPAELLAVPPADPNGTVGQVLASGPGLPGDNQRPMVMTLVYGARRRLALTESFLVPDEALLTALTAAARRGVAVELFVGEDSDHPVRHRAQRSAYAALLEAGVRIFRHPGRLDARHLAVDDAVAVLGSPPAGASAVSVLLLGPEIVGRVRAVEDGHRAASTELTAAAWRRRPWPRRYLDNAARLASALREPA